MSEEQSYKSIRNHNRTGGSGGVGGGGGVGGSALVSNRS